MRTKHQTDLKWEYPGQYPDGTQNTSKLEAEIWARIEADPHFELAFDKVAEARSARGGARTRTDTRGHAPGHEAVLVELLVRHAVLESVGVT